jgi:hypothetical protein
VLIVPSKLRSYFTQQSLRVVCTYDARCSTSVRRNKMAESYELYRNSEVCFKVASASLTIHDQSSP